jgi:hypothetical protein
MAMVGLNNNHCLHLHAVDDGTRQCISARVVPLTIIYLTRHGVLRQLRMILRVLTPNKVSLALLMQTCCSVVATERGGAHV